MKKIFKTRGLVKDSPHPPEKDRCPEGNQYQSDNHPERPLVLCPHAFSPFRGYAIRNEKGDQDKGEDIDKVVQDCHGNPDMTVISLPMRPSMLI